MMDIDTILSRMDFQIPLFADFILDKYRDLKLSDPESARRIETRVFSRPFLLNILDNGNSFVHSLLFTHVPPNLFIPIMEELVDRYENGFLSGHNGKINAIIKANAPDRFLALVKQKYAQQIQQEPIQIKAFYWHTHFKDLPLALRHEYFDQTYPLLLKAWDSLAESPDFLAVLSNQTLSALLLGRPEVVPLAKKCLEYLVRSYEQGDLDDYDVCSHFQQALTLERFKEGSQFEMYLFCDLENGELTTAPELLDHLYQEGWNGRQLFELYVTLIQSDNLSEDILILEHLNSINEPLLAGIIRAVIQDTALMSLLEQHHLRHTILAVFASIIWRFHRREQINPARFSPTNVMEFLTINSRQLPCMTQIKTYLSDIAPQDMATLLRTALAKEMENRNQEGYREYAIANIMEFMVHFMDLSFVPELSNVLLHDFGDDDWLIQQTIQALSGFGDAAIDCLESRMGQMPEFRLLDVLDIIRRIGTQQAETLLLKHFDRLIRSHRSDTLATCQCLVSQKALARLAHKVGKKQEAIDKLHVIVKTVLGKADAQTQSLMDALPNPWKSLNQAMNILKSETARSILILPLKCGFCSDINDYECRNVISSPQGDTYIADELTCISCDRISEFTLAPMGIIAVTAELLRLTALGSRKETADDPFTGALKVLNSSILGKPMSVPQGIALYKEKIKQKPTKPDHYIGLGNIYRAFKQYAFAEEQYKNAIEHGLFYIESYLSLAVIAEDKGELKTALGWLEKGRPYLKRPLICKDIHLTAQEIMEHYIFLHSDLLAQTGSRVAPILPSEYMIDGKQMKRIGRNEKCPCGSNKKYKKCCMKGQ